MAYVPDAAIDSFSELSKGARLLYVFLCRVRNQETGRCFPSVSTTMATLGINRASVFALRKELAKVGWATFDGDKVTDLLGFTSPKNQTILAENKVVTFPSPKNQTFSDSDSLGSPKNQTILAENKELNFLTENAENQQESAKVQKIILKSPKNHTEKSKKSDSHIRNNQQIEPANRTSKRKQHVKPTPSAAVCAVFDHWRGKLNHPNAILTPKRQKAIESRLREGYTIEALQSAVDGCRASPWHMGLNDRETIFDDLELICRNGENVEKFISKLEQSGAKQNGTANGHAPPLTDLPARTRQNLNAVQQAVAMYGGKNGTES